MSRNVSRVDRKFQSDVFFLLNAQSFSDASQINQEKTFRSLHAREPKVPLKNPVGKFFRLICKIGTQLMPRMQRWLGALGHQRRRVCQHHHRHHRHDCCRHH